MSNLYETLIAALPKNISYRLTHTPESVGSYIKASYFFEIGSVVTNTPTDDDALYSNDGLSVTEWFSSGVGETKEDAIILALVSHIQELPSSDTLKERKIIKDLNKQLIDLKNKLDSNNHENYNKMSRLTNELQAEREKTEALSNQVTNLLRRNKKLSGNKSDISPKKKESKISIVGQKPKRGKRNA